MIRTRILTGAVMIAALVPIAAPVGTFAVEPAVTLRLATPEDPDRPSQPFLDRFVSEVETQSGGTMAIEVIYAAGGHEEDKEPIAARRVQTGDVDLAVIPTRAWTDAGVSSVQALMAPFLIDNDALLRAVATDTTVLQPMLDGMAEQGLVGLAIWPENLRHLFTFDENGPPLTAPSDLDGQTMFVIGSALQNQIMETLGATTSNVFPPDDLVRNGTLRGAEYSLWNYNLYSPATVTADVVFYPKYQTFVAEDAAWSGLSAEQQQIIRDAAAAARDALMAELPHDGDLVTAYCEQGGRAVLAGEANVAAFAAAAGPIYDQMRADPFTADAIDAIARLKESTTPGPAVEPCEPSDSRPTNPPVEPGPAIGLVPAGTYMGSHTREDLLEAGLGEVDAGNNAGDLTWRFEGDGGSWTIVHETSGYVETCEVEFEVLEDRIRMRYCRPDPEAWMDFRWRLDGDQLALTIVAEDSGHWLHDIQAIFGGPWTKVE